MNELIISEKKYPEFKINRRKRLKELEKVKVKDILETIEKYGIMLPRDVTKLKYNYINGLMLYEERLLGYKQTEIQIYIGSQRKSYFLETKTNLTIVTKLRYINDIPIYYVSNDLFEQSKKLSSIIIYYAEKINGKIPFGWESWKGYICQDKLSLPNDIALCHKAIIFLESLHFYLKVKYLLRLFNGINDIIKYICFVYFERTLSNVDDIRWKLI